MQEHPVHVVRGWRRWIRRGVVMGVFGATLTWPLWAGSLGWAQQEQQATAQGQPADAGATQPSTRPGAQDSAFDLAETMRQYQEAAKPGEYHQYLQPMVGQWRVVARFAGPDGPMTSHGSATTRWIMGNRFLQQEFRGSMMGQDFSGMSLTGYDNLAGQYQAVWLDETSSGMFITKGTVSEDGKRFTFVGEAHDPTSDERRPYRHVIQVIDNNEHMLEMYEPAPSGEMMLTTSITYIRVQEGSR